MPPDDDLHWLYLDLNSFFASVEQQLQPALRGRPVAVVPALTDATCAIAASYEAKAYGIKTGTKIYEAKRLCKHLVCVPADHERYVYFHRRVQRAIERHLPIYAVESIDEFSCKLDTKTRDETTALALARRIKADIQRDVGEHIRSSVGLGPNRFLAKTASNLEKPDGLQRLHRADVPARIAKLPIDALVGIGPGNQRRLWRVGVVTVGDLYALAPKQMRQIWGSVQGERYYHLLRGEELPPQPTQRRTVGHSHVLEPEWRPATKAREVMDRLLLKAASRLRRLEYEANTLTMSIRVEGGPRLSHSLHFDHCSDNWSLKSHGQALWDTLMHGAHADRLKKVSLTLHGLRPAGEAERAPSLFDVLEQSAIQRRKRHEQLSRAMDDLNSRFGRDTVSMGNLPHRARCFSGTKVAFTRIPELEEFYE